MTAEGPDGQDVPWLTLTKFVQLLPIPTFVVDWAGRLIAVSDSWRILLDRSGVVDRDLWLPPAALLPGLLAAAEEFPDYRERAEQLRRVLRGTDSERVELPVPFGDGPRWFSVVSSQLTPVGPVVVSMTDITERRTAETQLAHHHNHDRVTVTGSLPPAYLAVVAGLTDAALLYRNGVLIHANPEALRVLTAWNLVDQHRPDLAGVMLSGLIVPQDHPRQAAAMQAAGEGRAVPATRLTFDVPGGGRRVVSCVYNPLELDGDSYIQVLARDVTARAKAEVAVARSEVQFRAVFDHSPVGVALLDGHRFAVVNPAMCRILGRSQADLIGRTAAEVSVAEDQAIHAAACEALDRGEVAHSHTRYLRPDGQLVWGELVAVRINSGDGPQLLVHLRDVTEARRDAEHLQHLALHDAMTGLGNRALLQDRLSTALARRERHPVVAVLFIDLDGFKRINDAFGHAVGDRVLKVTAQRIRDLVRPADTVTRWGGDEFVVLLEELATAQEALGIVTRVEQAVAVPIAHDADELIITASVGVAYAGPGGGVDPAQLIHDADAAMYRAKQSGRHQHSVFDSALSASTVRRTHIEAIVRQAAHGQRIVVHYQPIIDLRTRQIIGAEALVRLTDDDGTLLYPDSFLAIAEDAGLMIGIDEVVLRTACRWAAQQSNELSINVNFCAKHFEAIDVFEPLVHTVLRETGLTSSRLVCEVTEHAVLNTSQDTIDGATRLQQSGVQFSVDDFGVGYGSMTYLRALPFAEVKVDRSFVAEAPRDPRAAAIVRAVAGLASDLGMRSVAEGIEDEQTHQLAQQLGADFGQGYLYSRPLPPEAFAQLLT